MMHLRELANVDLEKSAGGGWVVKREVGWRLAGHVLRTAAY